jgi:hypothetical protein
VPTKASSTESSRFGNMYLLNTLLSGRLLCCAFKERQNRKTVRFLSTYMNAVHNQNEKPSIATTYNKFMGGVDMNDMMS